MPRLNRKALPFIVPFAVLAALIPIAGALALPARMELALRLALPAAALALCWGRLPAFRVERPAASVLLGVAVFVVW